MAVRWKSDPSHAASYISWNDWQDFLKKLNDSVGRARFSVSSEERAEARTTSLKFALPTEAQWEYACRAGTTTRFYYGDDPDDSKLKDYAGFDGNAWDIGEKYAHPVGRKKPNAWGLYDLHGNVYEWCQDWYSSDYYNKSPEGDLAGAQHGTARVLRGGSWGVDARGCRSASRCWGHPVLDCYFVGVRICLRDF